MESRPEKGEFAPFYASYVARVPAGNLLAILKEQIEVTRSFLRPLPADQADYRYAAGKWSVKEVVGHMADVERIMGYRALRFSRGDQTPLPGFDENAYIPTSGFSSRSLVSIVEEFHSVRNATITLFSGLSPEAWLRAGTANNNPVTVRALGCIIAGHELHHREIIKTRYLGATAKDQRLRDHK